MWPSQHLDNKQNSSTFDEIKLYRALKEYKFCFFFVRTLFIAIICELILPKIQRNSTYSLQHS